MTTTSPTTERSGRSASGRRAGYVITAAINAAVLWIAHQLLDWQWPRFLTDEFADVLPLITISCIASIVTNLAYVWYDPAWFKSSGNLVTSGIDLIVAIQMYVVFPFDFSTYATNWSWLARTVLIVVIVGTSITVIVELVRLVRTFVSVGAADGWHDPSAESHDDRNETGPSRSERSGRDRRVL
jgi:hypothetical protein